VPKPYQIPIIFLEGLHMGTWAFLKLGVIVMFPALILSLAALLLI
jgi:arsenical pump membrane protein